MLSSHFCSSHPAVLVWRTLAAQGAISSSVRRSQGRGQGSVTASARPEAALAVETSLGQSHLPPKGRAFGTASQKAVVWRG